MMQRVPAAERNKIPICRLLEGLLNPGDRVLEIASGTGQHVEYFAAQLPQVAFYPSELELSRVNELSRLFTAHRNILPARQLDVCDTDRAWGRPGQFDAVIVANLFHVSGERSMRGFLEGAGSVLREHGFLHVYGPFKREGRHTSAGNAQFDLSLRQGNPAWGIRDLEVLLELARRQGFDVAAVHQQPANNLSIVLRPADP